MSDNLFDRLFELFQTTDRINWRLAEEITKSLAGAPEPIEPQLAEEYEELALAAQLRLANAGALDGGGGTVPYPIDRAGWATENHRGFAYLIDPLSGTMGDGVGGGDPMAAMMGSLGPALLGMQAGTMVGFISHRVMGQFDTALPPLDHHRAYLVVPNVEAFAAEHDLDARQVRLWATMHELISFAVIGIDTLRHHIIAKVQELYAGLDFDPSGLMEKLNQLQDPAQLEGMLSESDGLASLFGGEPRPELASGVQAAAAFIEGYGDYVVRVSGSDLLPDLPAIEAAHRVRRSEPSQGIEQLGQLIGLQLQRPRAADAAELCGEIARRWGPEALDRIWETPDHLPHLEELTDPVGWAARVLLE
jgi:putative hydrolase